MSNRMPDALIMEVVDDGYKLVAPFRYVCDDGFIIIVPKGFVTDLASIPRLARFMFTGHGLSRKPAVIHDFLYSVFYDRKQADKIFLDALKDVGMNWVGRRIMYRAVRLGGWLHYRSKDNHLEVTP